MLLEHDSEWRENVCIYVWRNDSIVFWSSYLVWLKLDCSRKITPKFESYHFFIWKVRWNGLARLNKKLVSFPEKFHACFLDCQIGVEIPLCRIWEVSAESKSSRNSATEFYFNFFCGARYLCSAIETRRRSCYMANETMRVTFAPGRSGNNSWNSCVWRARKWTACILLSSNDFHLILAQIPEEYSRSSAPARGEFPP